VSFGSKKCEGYFMIRNHITKSALIKRINLNDEKTACMVQYIKLFYFFLVCKYRKDQNINFAKHEGIDPFISGLLERLAGSGKKIIPDEIEQFFYNKKIDFESFSLEIANKCSVCGKMSSIELDKNKYEDEISSIDETSYFCSTCFSVFKKSIINKTSKTGQHIQETEEDIEYYGNTVLAAVYDVVEFFNLEKKYCQIIYDFSVAVIDYIYSDDDKPHRYFVKLFEEMAEDYIIHKLVFLNPNYKYDYPNFVHTFIK
jgi:hypothetical protein